MNFKLALITCLTLLACTGKKDRDTLYTSLNGEISSLDPASAYDSVSNKIVYQCYEALYEYHYLKRPYQIRPLLAQDLPSVSEDGKTYTIKIRPEVRYHDDPAFGGKPRFVKAEDFITQIKRLTFKPTISQGRWLFDGKIVGIDEWREEVGSSESLFETTPIKGLRALDDYTLEISLQRPFPQMIYALAMSFTTPIPIEVFKYYKNDLTNHVVGTGPYVLKKWVRQSKVILQKFDQYRKDFYPGEGDRLANGKGLLVDSGKVIPFIEKINFEIIKESHPRWIKFRAKELDYLSLPIESYFSAIDESGELRSELKKEGIQYETFPTLTYWWLAFNMHDPILGNNKLLRQAIAHAIDIDKFIQTFTSNIGQKANSIFPPGIPGYDPTIEPPYEYNLSKAKKLLELAGHPMGQGLPEFRIDTRGTTPTNKGMAEFIIAQLSKIGIKLSIEVNSFPGFLEKSRKGDLQIWIDGWILDYPDAENVVQLLIKNNFPPGPNSTYFSDPIVEKAALQINSLENGPEKFRLMNEIESVVQKEVPWVMLYYSRNYILYHNRVKNFRPSDIVVNDLKYLRLENE